MRIWMSVLMIFLMVAETTAQCSMCRAVLESGDAQETAKGINNGIIWPFPIY
jgi:hypothetical protein